MKGDETVGVRDGAGADGGGAGARKPRSWRLPAAVGAGALVALLVLVVVWTTRGADGAGDGGTTAAETATPAPRPEPVLGGPEPSAPPADPGAQPVAADELPPSLAPVAFQASAATGDGVTATVPVVEAVDGVGQGRGNVSGPAVRVTVRLTNGTDGPVDLSGVAVRMTYGSTPVPAPRLDDPSQDLFTGSLAPGGSADGSYVFSVPADSREVVTVSVGYRAGAPFMVFTGSAP